MTGKKDPEIGEQKDLLQHYFKRLQELYKKERVTQEIMQEANRTKEKASAEMAEIHDEIDEKEFLIKWTSLFINGVIDTKEFTNEVARFKAEVAEAKAAERVVKQR